MIKTMVTQPDAITWAASGTPNADIEKQGLLTELQCTAEITPSATLEGACQPDSLSRVVQNLRITGRRLYTNLPADAGGQGGTLLRQMNLYDGHGVGHGPASVTAPISAYTPMTWVMHFGSLHPLDPWDVSGFIPAFNESSLKLEWATTPNSVMDDTVTISSASMRLTLHQVIGNEREIVEEMRAQGVLGVLPPGVRGMTPAWSGQVEAIPSAATGWTTFTVEVPASGYLKRIGLLAQDATATRPVRATDEVSEIRLYSNKTHEEIIRVNMEALSARLPQSTLLTADVGLTQAVNEGGTATYTVTEGTAFDGHYCHGVAFIDLNKLAASRRQDLRTFGWNMSSFTKGDLELGMIVDVYAAGDDLLVLWIVNEPYDGPLA